MQEYEYSFKVKDLKPYIDYLNENNYNLISTNEETRDLYKNGSGVMARITKNNDILFDFKDDDASETLLKERRESLPLTIEEKDLENVYSILDMLGYKLSVHLVRKREVYEKGNVKFELDDYTSPEIMKVIAVEGNKEEVDKVYNYLKENINE